MKFLARLLAGLALLYALTLLSSVSAVNPVDYAVLRLNWRLVGAKVERRLSEQELGSRPLHMRPADGVVESTFLPYRLRLKISGQTKIDEIIQPGGVQRDRPLFVLRELPLSPGRYRIEVDFRPVDEALAGQGYSLDQTVDLTAGRISTVRISEGRQELILPGEPSNLDEGQGSDTAPPLD